MFKLFVPKQAVGANLVYFDLFNAANSGFVLSVVSVLPVVSGAVAVTGVVGVDLILTRTSAVGTGGTAATYNGTDTTACTISGQSSFENLPATITARLTPSGGATAGAVLSWASVFTEETSAATYAVINNMASDPIYVKEGTGVRVVQGAVASVGNIGFNVGFVLLPKAR